MCQTELQYTLKSSVTEEHEKGDEGKGLFRKGEYGSEVQRTASEGKSCSQKAETISSD